MNERREILTGRTFGLLTAGEIVGRSASGDRMYQCACACGGSIDVPACSLKNGSTKSCGCIKSSESYKRKMADASKKAVQTIQDHPEIRQRIIAARYATQAQRDKISSVLSDQRNRMFIDGVNVPGTIKESANANSKTGVRGVYWVEKKHCYQATAQVQGRKWRKSGFSTVAEAKAARDAAHAELLKAAIEGNETLATAFSDWKKINSENT